MDNFVTKTAPQPLAPSKGVDDSAARAAWNAFAKPVTEEAFVAWYLANVSAGGGKKRGAASGAEPAPKRQAQAAPAGAAATLGKGKRTALLKGVTTSLKANIKGKKGAKWHAGDVETLNGTAVMDKAEFDALFPGVAMTKKGVATSFVLEGASLEAAFGGFKASVVCWSRTRPGSFQKSYKTGSQDVSLRSAEGKFSTGTSTLTLKFRVEVAGGHGGFGGMCFGGGFGFGDY